jgi:acyl carrier protein
VPEHQCLNKEEAMESLTEIVADVLEIPQPDVLDETGQGNCAEWTSLKHLQLVVALEEAYGVSFTSREIRDLNTVHAVRETLRGKGAPA